MRSLPCRVAALVAALAANAAPAAPYMFIVYGDSRASDDCKGNAVHTTLVRRMAAANPVLVLNTGDMITGYSAATNWVARGTCPLPQNGGSLKEIIAPLQERKPPGGLPTAYFPVIGNHDDNWGSKWYPDKAQAGICEAFDMKALVPNHTTKDYYQPRILLGKGRKDDDFYALLCSTSDRSVYPRFAYYSFDYEDAHFVVLRVNNNNFNLEECKRCNDPHDYDDYPNIHQLHWLEADLAAARANPRVRHIFAFVHAPIFGSGEQHPNVASAKVLASTFTKHGVKVAFTGHSHVYERSFGVVVDEKSPEGVREDSRGTVYVTTGGGGSPLHGFKPQPWYTAARRSAFHYVEVHVDGDSIRMRAIDVDGREFDEVKR